MNMCISLLLFFIRYDIYTLVFPFLLIFVYVLLVLLLTDYGPIRSSEPMRAVSNVSLHVDRGECFGLLGPNGAGKTTLISIVSGLLRASSGSVTVAGVEVNSKKSPNMSQTTTSQCICTHLITNDASKSTLISIVSGLLRASSGSMTVAGVKVSHMIWVVQKSLPCHKPRVLTSQHDFASLMRKKLYPCLAVNLQSRRLMFVCALLCSGGRWLGLAWQHRVLSAVWVTLGWSHCDWAFAVLLAAERLSQVRIFVILCSMS